MQSSSPKSKTQKKRKNTQKKPLSDSTSLSEKNDIKKKKAKPSRRVHRYSKSLNTDDIFEESDLRSKFREGKVKSTANFDHVERRVNISSTRPNLCFTGVDSDDLGSGRLIITIQEQDEMIADLRSHRRTRSNTFVGMNSGVRLSGMKHDDEVKCAPKSTSGFCTPFTKVRDDMVVMRKSLRFNVGYADTFGKRTSMEDKMFVLGQVKYDIDIDAFGLFDGHGGLEVSEYANEAVNVLLDQRVKRSKDNSKRALLNVIRDVNEGIKTNKLDGGSTCLVALIREDTCYVCNLGDCRAVFCTDGKAERITEDHTPANPKERERIIECGGEITESVTRDGMVIHRINSQLSLSRCLGDFPFSEWLSYEPDIFEFNFSDPDDYLILACDGLWDVISDQEAVDICNEFLQDNLVEKAAQRLRDVAYFRGSKDNISVMIIKPINEVDLDKLRKKSKGNCTIS